MDFLALDFETANAKLSSICQIGLVKFRNGEPTETFSTLVDPEDFFDQMNVAIHGIDESRVIGAPKFPEVYRELSEWISGSIVACHTLFDRAAMRQTSERYGLGETECIWLDTTRVVRRVWPQYAHSGYGLANLAKDFRIEFLHHDATEDARATGLILSKALREGGKSLEEWLTRSLTPLSPYEGMARTSNPDGPLVGETVVFTGALSIPRKRAADLAAHLGCEVAASVSRHTTLLVVGDQDVTKLNPGQTKSTKHVKAEALISEGVPIKILRESDFANLAKLDGIPNPLS